MISIKNLTVGYGEGEVLEDFSLDLKSGELYALIGPSGCGKSTLLKVLCGIKKEYTGAIEYNGLPVKKQNISIGYVPQNYGLLDWKSVKENIRLPLKLDKTKKTDESLIAEITSMLEITDLMEKYPRELSGGQKQRVALARVFALGPDLLLMDEPFSALDAFTSAVCQKLFLKIWSEHRVTALFITHNINEAVSASRQILMMNKSSKNIFKIIDNPTFGLTGMDMEKLKLANDILHLFEEKP